MPEDPADYFDVIPVDSESRAIEGLRGLMHPDVLAYMRSVGPRPDGDYLFYANSGRLRYTLSEETEE